MSPATPPTPPAEPQPEEKQPWTTPELKKLDIEETAFFGEQSNDGDGFS
jgi:hypothetical protein